MKDVKVTNYYPTRDVNGHAIEFEIGNLRAELYNYPDMGNIKARGDYYIFKGDTQVDRGTSFDKDVYFNVCDKMQALNKALSMEV